MLSGRPMVVAAVMFMVGISLHSFIETGTRMALGFSVTLFLGALAARGNSALSAGCLAVAFGTLGQLAGWTARHCYPVDHIARFIGEEPRLVRLEARIVDPPRLLVSPLNHRPLPPAQATRAEVLRVLTVHGWRPACGRIVVHVGEPHVRLATAQTVRLTGLLSRPGEAENPGEFDWSDYYRQQRILVGVSTPHRDNIEILQTDSPSWLDRLRIAARDCLEVGFKAETSTDHALLRALVLGDTDPQLRDIQDQFVRTGTSHHLAISGMHIAIIGGLGLGCLRLAGMRPRAACLAAMGIVLLYGAVVLPNPPVVRSVLLCVAIGAGMLTRRGIDPVQLLAVTVMAMLAWHPLDLVNAGFQLSFGTVFGLMLFSRPATGWLDTFGDRDLALAADARPQTWRGLAAAWSGRALKGALVASVVAWLVSSPLIAWHFNQLNPWAIAASILLAIPVLLALVGGVMKILLTLLLPGMSATLAAMAAWPVQLMRVTLEFLDRLPGGNHPLPKPSPTTLAAYYLLLALPLLLRGRPHWQRRLRWSPLLCPVLLLAPVLWRTGPSRQTEGECTVTFLSVGAGQCAIAQLPSGRTFLFDAGSQSAGDLYRRRVQPAMRQLGVISIDTVFLSHANFDHFSAIGDLLRQVPVGRFCLGPTFRQDAGHNYAASLLEIAMEQAAIPTTTLARSMVLEVEPGVSVEVLWPTPTPPGHDNDASLVVKLIVRGRSILFCGDIQTRAQAALLARPGDLATTVLVAPHHGSAEPTTAAFLRAAGPKLIIASNSWRLSGKQLAFDRLAGSTPLVRTGRDGAITLRISQDGRLSVETWRTRLRWQVP